MPLYLTPGALNLTLETPHPRVALQRLAEAMQALPTEGAPGEIVRLDMDALTSHHFTEIAAGAKHVYLRVLHLPKGTAIIGMEHTRANVFVMASGRLALVDPETGAKSEMEGFNVALTAPGTQRNGYALEDTVVMNIFSTAADDPGAVVAEIARPPFQEKTERLT